MEFAFGPWPNPSGQKHIKKGGNEDGICEGNGMIKGHVWMEGGRGERTGIASRLRPKCCHWLSGKFKGPVSLTQMGQRNNWGSTQVGLLDEKGEKEGKRR
jgi:hypothetical protein